MSASVLVPDAPAPSPATGAAVLRDRIGCPCRDCAAIRAAGPAMPGNPLARLQSGRRPDAPTPDTPRNARARMDERRRAAVRSLSARAKARHALTARYAHATLETAITRAYHVTPTGTA